MVSVRSDIIAQEGAEEGAEDRGESIKKKKLDCGNWDFYDSSVTMCLFLEIAEMVEIVGTTDDLSAFCSQNTDSLRKKVQYLLLQFCCQDLRLHFFIMQLLPKALRLIIEEYIWDIESLYTTSFRIKLVSLNSVREYHLKCVDRSDKLKGTQVIYDEHFYWKDTSQWKPCMCHFRGNAMYFFSLSPQMQYEAEYHAGFSDGTYINVLE
jgi:hypothetical protein